MKISIIIPSYKRVPFLADTLECVAAQDYPKDEYEIIIVDNGPTPSGDLRELCHETPPPAIRYLHEPKNGATTARHAGVKAAQGEFLVFVDDDVLCEPGWLRALVAPLEDKRIGLVAGKVVLKYETPPPEWIGLFHSYLSGLDRGEKAYALPPYQSAHSCNMAARRDAFVQVGGINPDYYGDPDFLPYCGDGECGLARKLHDAGFIVWYSPEAWLHHRVSAARMTLEYMERRARIAGIETVYRVYRYELSHPLFLLGPCTKFLVKCAAHRVLMWTRSRGAPKWFRHHVSSLQHLHSVYQCMRLLSSRKLRAHVKNPRYLA